jgi:hypothetical protein
MNRLFIACNHAVQLILHAASGFDGLYCTQQTRGLTRGMTLRAIQAAAFDRTPNARGINGASTTQRHCVQYANVRFRADVHIEPCQSSIAPKGLDPIRAATSLTQGEGI